MNSFGLILASIFVLGIITVQIYSFLKTKSLIDKLRNFFPPVAEIKCIPTMVDKSILNNNAKLKSFIDNPPSVCAVQNKIEENELNPNDFSEVSIIQHSKKEHIANCEFEDVLYSTNSYLCKNSGTSADFEQLKSICESRIDSLLSTIHNSLNVPLYLGLGGTFIGIIIGLWGIDFNEIFTTKFSEENTNSFSGLQHLLWGVIAAMFASFIGLGLTIWNTAVEFKKANLKIDEERDTYYNFLRRELMPVLSNSMASSLNSLRGVLGHFVDKFGRNLDAYADSAELLNDNLEKQHLVLQELNQLGVTQISHEIVNTFNLLKESSDNLKVFKAYQDELNNTIKSLTTTTEKIDNLFEQFSTMRTGLDLVVANQNNSSELQRTFQTAIEEHFPKGNEAREMWRKEFDTLIQDAKIASESLSEQLEACTQYVHNFTSENQEFYESFGKLREIISTLVSYADVQSQCYRDLKDEMLAMRNDFKDAQKQSAETNKAILEAVKVMTKAIKEQK
jgi:hypothetical protein